MQEVKSAEGRSLGFGACESRIRTLSESGAGARKLGPLTEV